MLYDQTSFSFLLFLNFPFQSDSKKFYITLIPDDPENTTMIFYNVTTKTRGWAGIGFGPIASMENWYLSQIFLFFFFINLLFLHSDFIVWSSNGAMLDQYGIEQDTPKNDKLQNFNLTSISLVDNWLNAQFWRFENLFPDFHLSFHLY
jgi:hypothetical protein